MKHIYIFLAIKSSSDCSFTNNLLQTEKSLLCGDTGTVIQEPPKRFQPYKKSISSLSCMLITCFHVPFEMKEDYIVYCYY